MSKMNNIQVDDAQGFNIVIPKYKVIEYSDVYSKTSGCLLKYYIEMNQL